MLRGVKASVLAGFCLAAGLAGCTPAPLIDRLPGELGLPAGAPSRPAAPYQYPAVHDMPPDRATSTMTEAEQVELEKELQAARDRTASEADPDAKPPPPPKAAPAAKKKPATAKSGQGTGARTSP